MNKLRPDYLSSPLSFAHQLREFGLEGIWNLVKFEFCLAAVHFYPDELDYNEQVQMTIEQHRG